MIVYFGEYDGLFTDQTGTYMWHCHTLEHKNHDMMRPSSVLPNANDDIDTGSDGDDDDSITHS